MLGEVPMKYWFAVLTMVVGYFVIMSIAWATKEMGMERDARLFFVGALTGQFISSAMRWL